MSIESNPRAEPFLGVWLVSPPANIFPFSRRRSSGSFGRLEEEGDAGLLAVDAPDGYGGAKMRRPRQETLQEKFLRYRGVILVVSVPLLLIAVVLAIMPRAGTLLDAGAATAADPLDRKTFDRSSGAVVKGPAVKEAQKAAGVAERFAVVIDCGSTGSRVHVYHFDEKVELLDMGGELELFVQKKPGLSAFSADPKKGGDSLRELLDKAVAAVPEKLRTTTPVRVGATAGLRLLPGDEAENLLKAVRSVLGEYPFTHTDGSVSILDGADEGSFAWVTVNYLLGNLGKGFGTTVGVVDLGGGSVQMTYAVSDEVAAKAPKGFVRKLSGMGKSYQVYVHSYLGFGLMAARYAVLKLAATPEGHACIAKGHTAKYAYGKEEIGALARAIGSDSEECAKIVKGALKVEAACSSDKCSFGGVWSGGGGEGFTKIYVASYFFDRASQLGVIADPGSSVAEVKPSQFADAASKVCKLSVEEIPKQFPRVDAKDAPYVCLDVSYQYVLLTAGFGIDAGSTVALVKKIKYKGKEVEAAWPLGAAIDALSTP